MDVIWSVFSSDISTGIVSMKTRMSSEGRDNMVFWAWMSSAKEKLMIKSQPTARKMSMMAAECSILDLHPKRVMAHFMENMLTMMDSFTKCSAREGAWSWIPSSST